MKAVSQAVVELDEKTLFDSVSGHYLGTAKINLSAIELAATKPIRNQTVTRLKSIFRSQGCRRLDRQNYIAATIRPEVLQQALEKRGWSASYFRSALCAKAEIPFLDLGVGNTVRCMQGRSRVIAGRQYLEPPEQWWTVQLYRHGKMRAIKVGVMPTY